jgi:hypothetical protein
MLRGFQFMVPSSRRGGPLSTTAPRPVTTGLEPLGFAARKCRCQDSQAPALQGSVAAITRRPKSPTVVSFRQTTQTTDEQAALAQTLGSQGSEPAGLCQGPGVKVPPRCHEQQPERHSRQPHLTLPACLCHPNLQRLGSAECPRTTVSSQQGGLGQDDPFRPISPPAGTVAYAAAPRYLAF